MGGDPWQAIQMYQADRVFASVPILSEGRCFVMGLECVKPSHEKQGDLCTAAVRSDHILYSEKSGPEAAVHLQVNFFVQNINVTA